MYVQSSMYAYAYPLSVASNLDYCSAFYEGLLVKGFRCLDSVLLMVAHLIALIPSFNNFTAYM